ncbi:22431_t:CDS:2 [Cetraspora pellucida]|uniref:22431_t:CDS:1 n=1 Tax=Cetraspora pellucida TaxID=1433469 RepID=A0A9N8VAN9_9GLOM|nr:22431_t:CDS:2 [Cetraspora pellucida]
MIARRRKKNFVDTLNRVLDAIIDDDESLKKLHSFGIGDVLTQRTDSI